MDDRLAIAGGFEAMPARFQPPAQLAIIVDFAVEDELDRAVFVTKRLIAAGDVDDLEPPHRQTDSPVDEVARAIGTAMRQRIVHASQQLAA